MEYPQPLVIGGVDRQAAHHDLAGRPQPLDPLARRPGPAALLRKPRTLPHGPTVLAERMFGQALRRRTRAHR